MVLNIYKAVLTRITERTNVSFRFEIVFKRKFEKLSSRNLFDTFLIDPKSELKRYQHDNLWSPFEFIL